MALQLEPYWKYVTVAKLRELLAELPDDARLTVNAVENLAVIDGATDEQVAWVDIGGERVEWYGPPTITASDYTLPPEA